MTVHVDVPLSPLDVEAAPTDASQAGVSAMGADDLIAMMDGQQQGSQQGTDMRAGSIAATKGETTNPITVERGKLEADQRAALNRASQESYDFMERQLAAATVQEVQDSPSNVVPIYENFNKGLEGVNNMRTSPIASEIATIQNAANIPLEQDVKERLAANLAMRNEVIYMMEDSGLADTVFNFAGAMISARDTLEWEDVKKGVTQDKVLREYISGESISGMIESFQALDPERVAIVWPILKQVVEDASGLTLPFTDIQITDNNRLLAGGMLLRFLEPEGGARASAEQKTLLAVDAIPVVGGIIKFAGRTAKGAKIAASFEQTARAAEKAADVQKLPKKVRQGMELVLRSAANKAVQENNIIKLLAEGGDIKQAVKINLAALDNEAIAKSVNIHTEDIVRNMLPEQTQSWFPAVVKSDKMVPEASAQLQDLLMRTEGKVRSMTVESDLLEIGALPKSDRRKQVRSFLGELERVGEDFLQQGLSLSKVNITKQDAQAFEFTYTMTNTHGEVTTHTGRRSWRINANTGHFEETVKALTEGSQRFNAGTSPAYWSTTGKQGQLDFNEAVKQALQLEDVAVATKQRINDLWIDANKDVSTILGTKGRKRIEDVEIAGDEYLNADTAERGKVFLPEELYAGINTRNGTVRLTHPNEVRAYYKRRLVADAFHSMQNYVTRRELELAGFKVTEVTPVAGKQDLLVRGFDTIERAQASVSGRQGYAAWNATSGKTEVITPQLLTEQYEKGMVLARLRENWNPIGQQGMKGGEHVQYIFMRNDASKSLPEQVLNYKYGYVPKITEGAEFVVKQSWAVKLQGKAGGSSVSSAIRAFASKADAKKFLAQRAEKLARDKNISVDDATKSFSIGDGSAMGQMERIENALSGQGGLFTGQRAKEDMLLGLHGTEMERISPSEAYGRYIDSLGKKISKNEWRIGKEKEWMNTVQKLGLKVNGFNGTLLPNTPEGKALGKMRDQINKWNVVPSREESLYEAGVQKMLDWAIAGNHGLGIQKESIKSILYLKHADPVGAMMSAAMHTMLGVMNPAQIFVQGSAATIALSLAPIRKIPNIMGQTARFAMFDNIKNDTALGKIFKTLVKNHEVDAKEINAYRLWQRSGLQESVRSNADMNYMSSTGLGLTRDVIRKSGNLSLLSYRTGELFNRRVSFLSAYHRQLADTPNAKMDDDFLSLVLEKANLTMLELNGANKAWWQAGNGAVGMQRVAAMSTQFQQVLAKTMELVLKGEKQGGFTLRQKARIGSVQAIMFGGAGVPFIKMFGGGVVEWVADKAGFNADTDSNEIEQVANFFNQGVTGTVAWNIFNAKVDVASRAGLGAGVVESVADILTSADPLWVKAFSVSGEVAKRVTQSARDAYAMLGGNGAAAMRTLMPLSLADRRSEEDLTPAEVKAVVGDMAILMANLTTPTRNLLKAAVLLNNGKVVDRRGNTKIERQYSLGTVLGVASGFGLSDESRLRAIMKGEREFKDDIKSKAEIITAAYHRWIFGHNASDAYAKPLTNMIQYQQELLDNSYEVSQLNRLLKRTIYDNPQTQEQRAIHEFILRTSEEVHQGMLLDGGEFFSPTKVFDQTGFVVPAAGLVEDNK